MVNTKEPGETITVGGEYQAVSERTGVPVSTVTVTLEPGKTAPPTPGKNQTWKYKGK